MAEQKVLEDVVPQGQSDICERTEGESLLLPLLQGLLDAPDNEQTADSGTESGEDLRNGLLIEVQNVLTKLSNSLKSDSNEMSPERRSSLLQLVSRLQNGLSSQNPGAGERRSSSGGTGRFTRRRRQNRHTVGVSSEELEDARKLIEEIGLCDSLNSKKKTIGLQKQLSEGSCVLQQSPQIRSVSQSVGCVKNSVAKPFINSGATSRSQSAASSTVQTPTDTLDFQEFPTEKSVSVQSTINHARRPSYTHKHRPLSDIVTNTSILEMSKPASPKVAEILAESNIESDFESASQNDFDIRTNVPAVAPEVKEYQASVILRSNPIYSKPKTFDKPEESKYNKFTKKQKMKRANTIDIPKPNNFQLQESEDDYDSDTSLVEKSHFKRNNYLALRGPIRVGRNALTNSFNKTVPTFEPKTESDRKFMAFINQHNENSAEKNSLWAHQKEQLHGNKFERNWNNRFGNIKTAFENVASNTPTPTSNVNSARNFWKKAEVKTPSTPTGNKFFAQKSTPIGNGGIVTGSLKVDTTALDSNKSYKLVPQPLPVNKFSHASTSAFASIPRKDSFHQPNSAPPQTQTVFKPIVQPHHNEKSSKSEYNDSDSSSSTPMYLYSPKPLQNVMFQNTVTPTNVSPSQIPWANNVNKSRVQNLVSSKFENNDDLNRGRYSVPPNTTQVENNAVRKLSNKFIQKPVENGYGNSTVHQYVPQKRENNQYSHYLNSYVPQNYTITYNTPRPQPKEPPKEQPKTNIVTKMNENFVKRSDDNIPKVSVNSHNYPDRSNSYAYSSRTTVQPVIKEEPPTPVETKPSAPTYQRQTSQESLKEYEAAQTRVMKGPVTHQAVTVQQKSPKGRDEHDMEAAFNLKAALQKFTQLDNNVVLNGNVKMNRNSLDRKLSMDSVVDEKRKASVPNSSPRTQSFKKISSPPNFMVNGNPLAMESTEVNENGESVVTSKFHIPVSITKPKVESIQNRIAMHQKHQQQGLSKTGSFHQLASYNQATFQQPRSAPVARSKSTHTLAVPTLQFQAAMTKDEVLQKKKTVEAYFSGAVSPQSLSRTPSDDSLENRIERQQEVTKQAMSNNKTSINRKKTSEKMSISRHSSGGVARSRTLPNIVCPNLLDESNVEASFEDLFKSNA